MLFFEAMTSVQEHLLFSDVIVASYLWIYLYDLLWASPFCVRYLMEVIIVIKALQAFFISSSLCFDSIADTFSFFFFWFNMEIIAARCSELFSWILKRSIALFHCENPLWIKELFESFTVNLYLKGNRLHSTTSLHIWQNTLSSTSSY